MKIRNLITDDMDVVSLTPAASVLEATKLMVGTRRGSVLVVGDDSDDLGIFTERDLMVRVVAEGGSPKAITLAEVMTTGLFTAHPEDKVQSVRREMRERHIRHLPVIEDGTVIAVLSMRDLLRADFEETREDAAAMRGYIQGG